MSRIEILNRGEPGKYARVANKMRLVKVSTIDRKIRPIHQPTFIDAIQQGAESLNTAEQLWR
jgi:hypothetical protein